MTRLTKERELELRKCCSAEYQLMLSEIDALRDENEELRKVYSSGCPECGYSGCVRGRKACDIEIDNLGKQRDRLQCEVRGWQASQVAVLDANERLKSRIEKLRKALDKIGGDRPCECCDLGVEIMPCTCFDFNPKTCADDALAQDDQLSQATHTQNVSQKSGNDNMKPAPDETI